MGIFGMQTESRAVKTKVAGNRQLSFFSPLVLSVHGVFNLKGRDGKEQQRGANGKTIADGESLPHFIYIKSNDFIHWR